MNKKRQVVNTTCFFDENRTMKTTDRIFQKGMALGLHVIKMKQPVKIEGEHALQRISQILAYENCSRPLIVTGPSTARSEYSID